MDKSTWTTKAGLAQMLKGGVIMDVVNPEQAKIAEEAGACAVMALERVPADIRAEGGVARMVGVSALYILTRRDAQPETTPAERPSDDQGDSRCRNYSRHG